MLTDASPTYGLAEGGTFVSCSGSGLHSSTVNDEDTFVCLFGDWESAGVRSGVQEIVCASPPMSPQC